MQAVSNTGRSGVLVLKVDEDDVNTVLMNTDIETTALLNTHMTILRMLFQKISWSMRLPTLIYPEIKLRKTERSCAEST